MFVIIEIIFSVQVKTVRVEKRINEMVNRLNRTKTESHPDFRELREGRDRKIRDTEKEREKERLRKEKEEADKKEKERELR